MNCYGGPLPALGDNFTPGALTSLGQLVRMPAYNLSMRPIATLTAPLFSAGKAESQEYINLRDSKEPETIDGKSFAERLWARYSRYADPHFLQEIRRDFHARFWEMYLTCSLLETAPSLGYHVSCPKPGPDILVEREGKRLWIEAVTVTAGEPSRPDSLNERVDGQMSLIPADKIVLRYSSAIATKHARYRQYLDHGVVQARDSWVVAINGWQLGYGWATGELPRFLKALFPLGALGYAIDPGTRALVDRRHQFRPTIYKSNRAPVSTDVFLKHEYRDISAALHSHAHAYMKEPLGLDFEVAHNPYAAYPAPPGLIPAHREWRATASEHGSFELASFPGTRNPSHADTPPPSRN
jgi:hypothetical protein